MLRDFVIEKISNRPSNPRKQPNKGTTPFLKNAPLLSHLLKNAVPRARNDGNKKIKPALVVALKLYAESY
jgi:hypothetical protein